MACSGSSSSFELQGEDKEGECQRGQQSLRGGLNPERQLRAGLDEAARRLCVRLLRWRRYMCGGDCMCVVVTVCVWWRRYVRGGDGICVYVHVCAPVGPRCWLLEVAVGGLVELDVLVVLVWVSFVALNQVAVVRVAFLERAAELLEVPQVKGPVV